MGLKKKSAVETLLIILCGSLVLGFALTAVTLLPVNGNHQSQALSTSRGSKGLRSTLSDDESISFGYDEDFMGQDERVEIETSVRDLAMELESVPDDHKMIEFPLKWARGIDQPQSYEDLGSYTSGSYEINVICQGEGGLLIDVSIDGRKMDSTRVTCKRNEANRESIALGRSGDNYGNDRLRLEVRAEARDDDVCYSLMVLHHPGR